MRLAGGRFALAWEKCSIKPKVEVSDWRLESRSQEEVIVKRRGTDEVRSGESSNHAAGVLKRARK